MTKEIIKAERTEVCKSCGKDFYPTDAKRTIGRRFNIGSYDYFFPEGDICSDCATEYIGDVWYEK